jgi:hypothetical protein
VRKVRTHYDNLKVSRDAPDEVIRAAYRVLCQRFHPDRNQDDAEAARIMSIINTSYAVLSDPEARRQHDVWIRQEERSYGWSTSTDDDYSAAGPAPAQEQQAEARPAAPKATARARGVAPKARSSANGIRAIVALYFVVVVLGLVYAYVHSGGGPEFTLNQPFSKSTPIKGIVVESPPGTDQDKPLPVPGYTKRAPLDWEKK